MARVEECDLFRVCATGDASKFEALFGKDRSILYQKIPEVQETSLHLASRYNRQDLVSKILQLDDRSFVQYIPNNDKHSALFVACSCERLEVALILCRKMDFKAWADIGASCLWLAASKGYEGCESAPHMDFGRPLKWKSSKNIDRSPTASIHRRSRAKEDDIIDRTLEKEFTESEQIQGVVENIVNQNPSLASRKDDNGFSAMHLAAREGKIEVIKVLLRRNKRLSLLSENNGRTPLQLAAVSREEAVVKEFLPGSTSYNNLDDIITNLINIADNDGDTILHHAATVNFLEILEILVTKVQGMNVNAVNKRGMTALDILKQQPVSKERNEIIQQLAAASGAIPIKVTPLQEALMVVAALICTIAFQAGLNPPGGFWQDSNGKNQTDHTAGKNQTDHTAGKAIQNTTNPWVLMAFTVFDAMAFSTALALIPTIIILPKKAMTYVNSLVVVALLCMEVTFILGLVMVSDGMRYIMSEIGALLLPLPFFLWILRKA